MSLKDDSSIPLGGAQSAQVLEFTRRQRVLSWVQVVVMAVLLIGFLVVVNMIARDHASRANWTVDKIEQLSPETEQRLKALTGDVQILLNVLDYQDRAMQEAERRTIEMLNEFARQCPRIKVTVAQEGTAAPPWLGEFGEFRPNAVFIRAQLPDGRTNRKIIDMRELYLGNPQTGDIEDFRAETHMISSIWTLVSTKSRIVYSLHGHDEFQVENTREMGLSWLASALKDRDNVELKALDIASVREIPRDADAVLVCGSKRDWAKDQLDMLDQYLQEGGRVLVAVEARADTPMLRHFLGAWGARVQKGIVYDKQNAGAPRFPFVNNWNLQHPLNVGLTPDFKIAILDTTGVAPADTKERPILTGALFRSSPVPNSFLDVNMNGKDDLDEPKGSIDLAVAAQAGPMPRPRFSERPMARIVVWGSAAPFVNQYLYQRVDQNDYMTTYVLNNFRWLLELERVVPATKKKQIKQTTLFLPPGASAQIGWISMAGLPLLGIVLGIIAWWFRRK